MKKAWRTTWSGMGGIIAAETAGQARAKTVRQAGEAFEPRLVKFQDVRVTRAPEFDDWAQWNRPGFAGMREFCAAV